MTKKEVKIITEAYENAFAYFDSMEWESAPSGEWAEYNHAKLAASAAVNAIEDIKRDIGIKVPDYSEEEIT